MEFIKITNEPCAIYRCCDEEFEVDPATEENLTYIADRLLPQCPKCGDVDLSSLESSPWMKVLTFPLWIVLILYHFSVCSVLTVFVHPERKRYKYYEYYSPWGWKERKDCPNDESK